MDKINQGFQDLLSKKQFKLKTTEESERFIYQGQLDAGQGHIIDFGASLTKSDILSIGQIVYNNIAYCSEDSHRPFWLETINAINLEYGLYYYMGMEPDGRIFLHHTGLVAQDIIPFFNMLVSGSEITSQILSIITEKEEGLHNT